MDWIIVLKCVLMVISASDLLTYFIEKLQKYKKEEINISGSLGIITGVIIRGLILYFIWV